MRTIQSLHLLILAFLSCTHAELHSWRPYTIRPNARVFRKDPGPLSSQFASTAGSSSIPKPASTSPDVERGGYSPALAVSEEEIPKQDLMAANATETPVSLNSTQEEPSNYTEVVQVQVKDGLTKRQQRKMERSHKRYARKLKNRNSMNLRRKVMHACFGLGFASLHHVLPRARFLAGMTTLTSATLLMELLRYRKHFNWMNDALHFVLGNALRKHEMDGKFTGSFYFFLGVTCTSYLFPPAAATLGICQLALADPSASYFGRQTRHIYWSRIENGLGGFGRNKGFLGFVGGALFCVPFNYRVLSVASSNLPGGKQSLLLASLLLGGAGAFADLAVPTPALVLPKKVMGVKVPPFHVDDNFVVPIFSGFAATKIFAALNWSEVVLAPFLLL